MRIRRFFGVLYLVRFSLLMAALALAVVFVAQGQEVLIAMADGPAKLPELAHKTGFVIATVLCAFSAWYTSRVMYLFRFDGVPASDADCYPRVKEYLPRWLGALVMLLVAAALLLASSMSQPSASRSPSKACGATIRSAPRSCFSTARWWRPGSGSS
jgi:hypothetical protein